MFYNPYGYQLGNYQPQMPVQQSYQPQGYQQNAYQQPQQTYQPQASVNFQPVDSFEAARAKDVDMSGQAKYYPNINGSEIYMKQLQADGTCPTIVFKRVVQEPEIQKADPMDEKLSRVLAELETIKSVICEPVKVAKTGGAKA